MMTIRPERPEEFDEIYRLIQIAFATAKVSDGDEQDFANGLRKSSGYLPQLALVAEENGQLLGHIMLTELTLHTKDGDRAALLLAPVCVRLEDRGRGVGSALIRHSMERATGLGYTAVFLVGDPAYYSRFGFRSTAAFGIKVNTDIPSQFTQCVELIPGALKDAGGTVDIV